jgi:GNAT superfamily N-acetyltransferase
MAAQQISILPAVNGDVPAILRFIRKLAEYENLSDQVVATEASLRGHLFGPRPAAEVLLARIESPPVGFALFFQTFSTFLAAPGIWLEDLFVLPEYRRRGVGRALLRRVASIALQRSCGRLEWSVLDWNEPALEFYQTIGAQTMDQWKLRRVTGEALVRLAEKTER